MFTIILEIFDDVIKSIATEQIEEVWHKWVFKIELSKEWLDFEGIWTPI